MPRDPFAGIGIWEAGDTDTTAVLALIDRGDDTLRRYVRVSAAGQVHEADGLLSHQDAAATYTLTPDGLVQREEVDGQTVEQLWRPSSTKQVICYRRDLKMRKGKIAAQCAHGSMAVFFRRDPDRQGQLVVPLDGPMEHWTRGSFAKIVLSVETEEDLLQVHAEARSSGLPTALITDAGRTEFKGVPTRTVVAVGPAALGEIDRITGPGGLVPCKLA